VALSVEFHGSLLVKTCIWYPELDGCGTETFKMLGLGCLQPTHTHVIVGDEPYYYVYLIFAISYQLVRTEFDPLNQGSDSFSREINKKHTSGATNQLSLPPKLDEGNISG